MGEAVRCLSNRAGYGDVDPGQSSQYLTGGRKEDQEFKQPTLQSKASVENVWTVGSHGGCVSRRGLWLELHSCRTLAVTTCLEI